MRPESLACLLSTVGVFMRLLDLLPDPIRAGRHVDVVDAKRAQRVADRVDDRDRAGDGARLADALDAELVGRRWSDGASELELREFVHGRDEVVGQRAGLHLTGLVVVNHLFVKGLRDALRDAAVDLSSHDHRVDDVAAVVDGDVPLEVHRARLRVNFDDGDVRAERPDKVAWVVVGDGLQAVLHALGKSRAERCECDLTHRLALVGAALDVELALVENDIFFGRLEEMGRELFRLVDDLLARLVHGHTTDREGAAAVRAIAKSRAFGRVPVPQLDHVVGDSECVGDDLREGRVVTLPVGMGAYVNGDRPGWKDAHLRALDQREASSGRGGGGARPEATDLDPARDADT